MGFLAGDANLYRYVGNNPVNQTDPSGLQAVKSITVSNPKEKGYENVPVEVFDVSSIAFYIGLSGHNSHGEFNARELNSYVFNQFVPKSLFTLAANSPANKGWVLEPHAFEITGLKFAKVTANQAGMLLPNVQEKDLEMGAPSVGPTKRQVTQSVYRPTKVPNFVEDQTQQQFPVAHFLIDGYFLYLGTRVDPVTKKVESKLFAIHLNYEVRTSTHSPYDKEYSETRAAFNKVYSQDPEAIIGSGSYGANYLGVREGELAGKATGPAIKSVLRLLKMAPGKQYKQGEQLGGIQLEIRTIQELLAGK